MFVRLPEHPPEVWQRFRLPDEGFEFDERAGLFQARVVAGAERALMLFHALLGQLGPSVNLRLHDVRVDVASPAGASDPPGGGAHEEAAGAAGAAGVTAWSGDGLDREQVRIAVEGARAVLARDAGVEIAVFDDENQVTLNPNLDVFIYARTGRWYPLLRGLGLSPYHTIPHRSWRLRPSEFPPSEAVRKALRDIARRFGAEPL